MMLRWLACLGLCPLLLVSADTQGWSPSCDPPSPGHFDFVEIGTNDFDTLIELARPCTRGISVDAMQFYLDRLPSRPHVEKINAAIVESTPPRHVEFFSADLLELERRNLTYLRGSGGASKHAAGTLERELQRHNASDLLKRTLTPALTFDELMARFDARSISYLKIEYVTHKNQTCGLHAPHT